MTITEELKSFVRARLIDSTVSNGLGCWLWTKSKRGKGYAQLTLPGRKQVLAHRYAYMAMVGDIPDGLFVCHSCDTPACCNPDHLFLGTPKENTADCVSKGRLNPGRTGGARKLLESDKAAIKVLYSSGILQREIAEKYGVSQVRVSQIVRPS